MKTQIDFFNKIGDCLGSVQSEVIPRIGDFIDILDRTRGNKDNPGGTTILAGQVKDVHIVYCNYGDKINPDTTPIINVELVDRGQKLN